ncbi:hypothetical protein WBG78_16520 [Chryseolinea sp. T2]|uniref:hypothetical protein n=1 Tax=Chryseolinea sp. T2 TaxID=3129255 RepID=UPI003076B1F5
MKSAALKSNLEPMIASLSFMKRHWIVLVSLGLIAALGRVIQLGGFGEVSRLTHTLLEIVVEASRVAILLFVLGVANVRKGLQQVVRLVTGKIQFRSYSGHAWSKMKSRWSALTFSLVLFGLIAWGLNLLINQLAYETCLYLTLKREGILVGTSSEWTILLFFKNLSVIPFTLVFETVLVLWLANKAPLPEKHSVSLH